MTNEVKNSDFGGRLDSIIEQSGLNKKDFAERCGIKETQLYNYLKGRSEPNTKALRNIKRIFPNVSIDWLVCGQGEPLIEKVSSDNILDLQHEQVIRKFHDKEFALEIDKALVALEKRSLKEFYKLGGYIKAMAETGVAVDPDRRQSQRRKEDLGPPDGMERRSGNDRRKALGG